LGWLIALEGEMMNSLRIVAAGAAALTLTAFALPASAQYYDRDHDRRDRRDSGDAVAGLVVGALVGGIAGAVIGDGDNRYVAGGALAGAALGAAAASDSDHRGYRSYNSSYGYTYGSGYGYENSGYRADCDYWRDGRCWRNRGHWEREHGINSRDPRYDRRDDRRNDRREWRSDRREDRRDNRRDDRRWRND
jgi:hypothetical protein